MDMIAEVQRPQSEAERLRSEGLERMDDRELRRYRLFYMTYPAIRETLSPEFAPLLPANIWQSLSAKSNAKTPETSPARRSSGVSWKTNAGNSETSHDRARAHQ